MIRKTSLVVLSTLVLGSACGGERGGTPALFTDGSGVRTVRTVVYDTIWSYGGIRDTILGAPTRLAAAPDSALYVLDPMLQQVVRLSPTGNLDWRWGNRGQGPGELGNVRAFEVTPDGGLVLADSGNCRLVFLSPEGLLEREQAIVCSDFSLIEGVAALSSGDFVLDTNRRADPWILVSADGQQDSVEVPWSGFATMHFIQRYGNVAASEDDTWVFAFEAGNGWFTFQADTPLEMFPYVEHTEFPEIIVNRSEAGINSRTTWRMTRRPAYSGYAMDVWKDTMYVLPGGHTPHRLRVLDKYDVRSGRYLHSQTLPDVTDSFAVTGDRVFVLDKRELHPQVISLRLKGAER